MVTKEVGDIARQDITLPDGRQIRVFCLLTHHDSSRRYFSVSADPIAEGGFLAVGDRIFEDHPTFPLSVSDEEIISQYFQPLLEKLHRGEIPGRTNPD